MSIAVPRSSYDNDSFCEVVPASSQEESLSEAQDSNERLIDLIEGRPGLWDHTIPVKERTTLKKNALWLEISNHMGGGKV